MSAETKSELVDRIAAQVEDNFWAKFKEYFHKHQNDTSDASASRAEVEKHQLPPYIEKDIGKYINSETESEDIFSDAK